MFKSIIVILLVSILASVLGAVLPNGRIVGGSPTTIEEYPFQVSLQNSNGQHICGGSILSEVFILTAAHCVINFYADSLSIRAGSTYKFTGGQQVPVEAINIHKLYDRTTHDYDIAILELSASLYVGSPVNLPSHHYPDSTTAVVTGWGALSSGGDSPIDLRKVAVEIINWSRCNTAYNGILTKRMLCAGTDTGGKDSCQGDSGGPLVVDGVQVGIVSWGWGCGDARWPGVYTDVYSLRGYITSVTGL